MKLHLEIIRLGDRATTTLDIEAELTIATIAHIKTLVSAALLAGADVRVNGVPQTAEPPGTSR